METHADFLQPVLICLKPGEEIGPEAHGNIDQLLRVESGKWRSVLDFQSKELETGYAVVVPAGVQHNVINKQKKKSSCFILFTLRPSIRTARSIARKLKLMLLNINLAYAIRLSVL